MVSASQDDEVTSTGQCQLGSPLVQSGELSSPASLLLCIRIRVGMKLVLESGHWRLGPWLTRGRVADPDCDGGRIIVHIDMMTMQ